MRQSGGLGISIAGGKGSTPYKGDDEVKSPPGFGQAEDGTKEMWTAEFEYTFFYFLRESSSPEYLRMVLLQEQE